MKKILGKYSSGWPLPEVISEVQRLIRDHLTEIRKTLFWLVLKSLGLLAEVKTLIGVEMNEL